MQDMYVGTQQHTAQPYLPLIGMCAVGYGHAATVRVASRSSAAHERQSAERFDVDLLLVSRVLVEAEER